MISRVVRNSKLLNFAENVNERCPVRDWKTFSNLLNSPQGEIISFRSIYFLATKLATLPPPLQTSIASARILARWLEPRRSRIKMRRRVAIKWPLTFLVLWGFGGVARSRGMRATCPAMCSPLPQLPLIRGACCCVMWRRNTVPVRPPQSPRADRDLCAHVRNRNIMNPH